MPTPEQYKLIDTLFPVAGQDNESQGFRDNFAATFDSLEYCETEITSLQENTVKLNVENTFTEDSAIKEAKLVACSEEVFDLASSATIRDQDIDYNFGGYQAFKLGAPANDVPYQFTITGWPKVDGLAANKGKYARIRVQLTSVDNQLRIPSFITDNNSAIRYDNSWPATLTVSSATHPTVVEFWTYDGGDTVYAKYLGVFGSGVGSTVVDNLTVNGNATLGNAISDTVTFLGIPKLPMLTGNELDVLNSSEGMFAYNTTSHNINIKTNSGWTVPGAPSMNGISDVVINSLQNKQVLAYNSSSSNWENKTVVNSITAGSGIGITSETGDITIFNDGVTRIIAGDNITIDNQKGNVTISAVGSGSGGSGFTSNEVQDLAATILLNNLLHTGLEFNYNTTQNKITASIDTSVVVDVDTTQTLDNKTLNNPKIDGLLEVSNVGTSGQILKVKSNGTELIWEDELIAKLDLLLDVDINAPRPNDQISFNSDTLKWTNKNNLVEYEVTVDDNGSGTQEVFYIDGTALQTNTGVQKGLLFEVGKKYRFKLDDVSNAAAPLKFSTKPDTVVNPDAIPGNRTIVPYDTNVFYNGTAGSAGSYVEIVITVDTPSPLYLYAEEIDNAIDTSLIGAAYPIMVSNKPIEVTSGKYTALGTQTIIVNSGSVATTIKLPEAPVLGTEVEIIDNGSAATHAITIDRNTKNIDGVASNKTISVNYGILRLTYNGTEWVSTNYHRSGLSVDNLTDASSVTTGALVVKGGVGIAKNLYVGGDITLTGNNTFTSTNAKFSNINPVSTDQLSIGGALTVANTTQASSASAASLVVNGGVGIAKNLIVTEATTLGNKLVLNSSDNLENQGEVELTTVATFFSTLTGPSTATLAAGTTGQIKTFMMNDDGGDMVITVTNHGWVGTGTMTFSNIGQGCTLQYINNRWFCIGNNGVAFA